MHKFPYIFINASQLKLHMKFEIIEYLNDNNFRITLN